jgi:hypothetical protein
VLDQRKRPIRGLWGASAPYYAQLSIEAPSPGDKGVTRLPLEKAIPDSEPKAEFQESMAQQRKEALLTLNSQASSRLTRQIRIECLHR